MKKKRVTLVLAACVCVASMSGCERDKQGAANTKLDFSDYPIKTEEKLTYWVGANSAMSTVVDNAAKTDFAVQLKKATGVDVEYIHPVVGQEATSLSLLIASGQMPDMVEYAWANYNGGAAKSLKEKIILPLNELIDENSPNLKKYLEDNPEIDKMVKTDDGKYYAYPFLRGDKRLRMSVGTMIRKDWLDELGLAIPETVDDMGNALKAFKEKKNADKPLSFSPVQFGTFLGNFSTSLGFYLDDGKVQFGPMSDNFEFALRILNKWYSEGLLDPNFVSIDNAALDSNVLNGKTGITVSSGGGGLGTWLDNKKESGEVFEMVGMPFTSNRSGEKNTFYKVESSYPGYGSVAITTSCKNPALAARFLDYGYSEKGNILYNFGTEGVSYELKDGEYIYTENVTKNPDGLTMAQSMANYFRASLQGPFVQQKGYIDQFYYRPQQQATLDAWLSRFDDVKDNNLPPINMTESETNEYTSIMNEVNKYVSTAKTNFINGNASFDTYADYKKQLKNLNIDRVIEIQQTAYDRYMAK